MRRKRKGKGAPEIHLFDSAAGTGAFVHSAIHNRNRIVLSAGTGKSQIFAREAQHIVFRSYHDYIESELTKAAACHEVPPAWVTFLLLLLPLKSRDSLVGDLQEEYTTVVLPKYGWGWAVFWYCTQVFSEIASAFFRLLRK